MVILTIMNCEISTNAMCAICVRMCHSDVNIIKFLCHFVSEKECGGCSSQPATLKQKVEPCWEIRIVDEWVDKLCDWAKDLWERAKEAWGKAKKKIEELKQKIEDWKQKVRKAWKRYRELKAIVETIKDMLKMLREKLKKLREEWDKMMEEFMKALDALDCIEKTQKRLENEVKKAEESLKKDLHELSKSKDKVAKAKARLDKAYREKIVAVLQGTLNDRINKEVNDALAEYSSALDDLDEAFTKATEGANKLADARSDLRKIIEEWSHAFHVLWKIRKALEEARNAYEDKEKDLKKAKDAKENAKKMLKEARDSLQNEKEYFKQAKKASKATALAFESAESKRLKDWNCRM